MTTKLSPRKYELPHREGKIRFPGLLRAPLGFILLSVVMGTAATRAEDFVTEDNAATFYRDFTRLTKAPHFVAPLTAVKCTTLDDPAITEREKQMTGPHYMARVHLYANPVALRTVKLWPVPFAIGAIIVKEKLAMDGTVTGVGGMIKRAPGYDPLNGDWEYFYYGGPKGFKSGRLPSCIECHRAARNTDFVYGVWGPRR
jgi:cytochrome P460